MRIGLGGSRYPGAFRYLIDGVGRSVDPRLRDQLFELLRG
jgi:hypothetical protein